MAIGYKLNEQGQRPWGTWEVIGIGNRYIVKKISVNPKSALSLQLHHHRGEHWVIVEGKAVVTVGEDIQELTAGKSVDIPKETKHRIENKTDAPLQFIEIQMGEILDEKDIVRFEDRYNRVNKIQQNSGRDK